MDHNPRLLIVDDDQAMADSVCAILQNRRYDLQTLNDPREALVQINQGLYDLVILDVMMPEMTGFQLLEAFDRERVDTLFIIMTGDASMESAVEAIRKGASDYLKKPYDPDELIIRVENLIRQIELNQRSIQAEKEQHSLELQLSQSQKMEAVGTLAGGIAHDFNNILSIMLGNTELAINDIEASNPSRQNLEKVIIAGNRAKEMVNQLLSFSRKKDLEQKPIELNTIVLDSLKLLRASIPTNIEIRHDISDTVYTVLGDTTQIHQIMLNLCTNAAHAMQDTGGVLTVKLKHVEIENNPMFEHSRLQAGEYIQLVVTDTGHGIDASIVDHIFDPYFTTKAPAKGTGMGLAVVHGIVKNHGGDIQVFSEIGSKTEFHILLPIINAAETAAESTAGDEMPGGRERILLVDDEEMLVDIMTQILEQLGYMVTGHTRSLEALETFRRSPDGFDLVITDMTMPNLTGDRLAEEIKMIRNDVPIILCTGFSERFKGQEPYDPAVCAVLMKPVGMSKLAQTIRTVIDHQQQERRKDTRYGLKETLFVISKTNPQKRAEVIDISRSGVSFQYTGNPTSLREFERVSIKTRDERFALDDITYETISDVAAKQSSAARPSAKRRLGGRFSGLTPFQNKQLAYFIENFAMGMQN